MNFAEQGCIYIDRLKTRNRRPIKPATAAAFECYLRKHVVPLIGQTELEPFSNGALKDFVQILINKKLAPKTIAEISAFVRAIVASVLDSDGNQIYPRTWNLDFVDGPADSKPAPAYSHERTLAEYLERQLCQDSQPGNACTSCINGNARRRTPGFAVRPRSPEPEHCVGSKRENDSCTQERVPRPSRHTWRRYT